MTDAIRFQASVSKVTTLADGGIRLVLDLPETAIDIASKMMQVRQAGAVLEVAAVPLKVNRGRKTEINRDTESTY